jgi:hypothetical protein
MNTSINVVVAQANGWTASCTPSVLVFQLEPVRVRCPAEDFSHPP